MERKAKSTRALSPLPGQAAVNCGCQGLALLDMEPRM